MELKALKTQKHSPSLTLKLSDPASFWDFMEVSLHGQE